jgi:hypothetical protein
MTVRINTAMVRRINRSNSPNNVPAIVIMMHLLL